MFKHLGKKPVISKMGEVKFPHSQRNIIGRSSWAGIAGQDLCA